MLHLLINCPGTEALIPAADVAEVVPLVELRSAPASGRALAGIMDYRGLALPVYDLGLLLGDTACARLYSTRILILNALPCPAAGEDNRTEAPLPALAAPAPSGAWNADGVAAGLLAQGVSDTIHLREGDLLPSPAAPRLDGASSSLPAFGQLAHTPAGTRTVLRAAQLLALMHGGGR